MSDSLRLRPVDNKQQPSSSSTARARSPPPRTSTPVLLPPITGNAGTDPRRPLSPGSLRDLDISTRAPSPAPGYPPIPTGHELMALFPPSAPANFSDQRTTSGYFEQQERAFFARGGREIVRTRAADADKNKQPLPPSVPRGWPPGQPTHLAAPPAYPAAPRQIHVAEAQAPSPAHSRTVPRAQSSMQAPQAEGFDPNDPDEAWRRPIPPSERRRAGKHTKRVVKS